MELQGLIVTVQWQLGGHGLTLGFFALLFMGVVFFPSSLPVRVVLFLSPAH